MSIFKKIDTDAILAAVEESQTGLSNPGFCVECGIDVEGVEPDARKYPCESCGAKAVFGAEELLLYIA